MMDFSYKGWTSSRNRVVIGEFYGNDLLAGRQFFFDHFTAPDAHFFWCQRRARQFDLDLSSFKHCAVHFERIMQRTSVQKLLAFEKSIQDKFAKAA
jgi:glutathione S-transferase